MAKKDSGAHEFVLAVADERKTPMLAAQHTELLLSQIRRLTNMDGQLFKLHVDLSSEERPVFMFTREG
jgi:hypothetical protein